MHTSSSHSLIHTKKERKRERKWKKFTVLSLCILNRIANGTRARMWMDYTRWLKTFITAKNNDGRTFARYIIKWTKRSIYMLYICIVIVWRMGQWMENLDVVKKARRIFQRKKNTLMHVLPCKYKVFSSHGHCFRFSTRFFVFSNRKKTQGITKAKIRANIKLFNAPKMR